MAGFECTECEIIVFEVEKNVLGGHTNSR